MKKYLAILFFMLPLAAMAQNAEEQSTPDGPKIVFAESEFEFGDLTQGESVEHIFTFKNEGTAPLILSNVLTTCGCTASDWPKEPIMPGKEGEVKVTFNSTGKIGFQNKGITILSNSVGGQVQVKLFGNVLPKNRDF